MGGESYWTFIVRISKIITHAVLIFSEFRFYSRINVSFAQIPRQKPKTAKKAKSDPQCELDIGFPRFSGQGGRDAKWV